MIIGAHVSTAGGVSKAPLNARDLGISAIQIFTRNQNRWTSKPISDQEVEKYRSNLEACEIVSAISHTSYLINLCANEDEKHLKSIAAMEDELYRAEQIGLDGVVLHPGSHLGEGEKRGIDKIATTLEQIIEKFPNGKARVLFEVTAGQGTNIGYRFEQIAELLDKTGIPERTGVCLDTCHMFAAGYDIRTESAYHASMKQFDDAIGFDNLYCIHGNDSKKEFASKRDRHEHIGEGFIGKDAFRFLLKDERFRSLPFILETPGEMKDYHRNIDLLRKLEKS